MKECFASAYVGRRVFITGHTGFKGSWLVTWLNELGAEITGYSLKPPTDPNIYEVARISEICRSESGDVRDSEKILKVMNSFKPEIVFHFAAQPIVRFSYEDPIETFSTNVMGTIKVLETVRKLKESCVVIIVTSDKCYENRDWVHAYRENDSIGGDDPYSASKGCAELVINSWRKSFMGNESLFRLASVRAGNVIGGGDWAKDRIVTDSIEALCKGEAIKLRNPLSTRPWQHVLEPLSGYLTLGAYLLKSKEHKLQSAWNFGPAIEDIATVKKLVELIIEKWGKGKWIDASSEHNPPEMQWLALEWSKSFRLLGWKPTWKIEEAVAETVNWYRNWIKGKIDMREYSLNQIYSYVNRAKTLGASWASSYE